MKHGIRGVRAWLLLAVLTSMTEVQAVQSLEQAMQLGVDAQKQAEQSQLRVDGLHVESQSLADEYRLLLRQHDELKSYDDQLDALVAKQKTELDTLAQETVTAQRTRARSLPLLRDMLTTLEQFVKLDLPFLVDERKARVDALKALIDAPDTPLAEKYRRLIEAYQVEADYGRGIEAQSDRITIGKQARTVDTLRVGRVALLYLSFDQREAGYWDQRSRVWRVLPTAINHDIAQALKVARKQAPPAILKLPVIRAGDKP